VLLAKDGTDVNATRINPAFPDSPLSALYGAAGFNHLPGLTKILLDAGANPNDGESVYHSTETRDLSCLKLLLAAGANPKGTNALNHALDRDDLECVRLLLEAGADPNEGVPALHWAIHRRRSVAHFDLLLEYGANPTQLLHGMITPYRSAMLHGMRAQAARIRLRAPEEPEIAGVERFIAACTAADRAEAEAMQAAHNWIAELPPMTLRLLPDMVEAGNSAAVRLMVDLGWPIGAVGGDWKATALNLAVFRGDPSLTAYLLEKGASWDERHGYNDNVRGTLSFASNERPIWGGDWVSCARALVAAGMPRPEGYSYPPEVQAVFDSMP
jgi:ankyrin repeat protein